MKSFRCPSALLGAILSLTPVTVSANAYRERGVTTQVGSLIVTPPRDWNRLSIKPGKFAETWTLDGEQLNEVTFYTGIEPGEPLVRERSRKRQPLPKFTSSLLLAEVPELLERTYRAQRAVVEFNIVDARPAAFLGGNGLQFAYSYSDSEGLPRRGEAWAMVTGKKLNMITFDAPRLHYFDRTLADFRALVAATGQSKSK